MNRWNSRVPKLKKGKWFVPIRGSYLPMTPQAWMLHALLIFGAVFIIMSSNDDTRSVPIVAITMALELIGLGALFTYIASKKA